MEHQPKQTAEFDLIEFKDANGVQCSIQQSSAIGPSEGAADSPGSSMLWLGIENVDPKCLASKADELGIKRTEDSGWQTYPIPKDVMFNDRMHLTRDQVVALISHLQRWADTGELTAD